MKGFKYQEIMQPFFDMPTDRANLEAVYRTLAKTADQRLVRLEGYQHDKNFKDATRYAYSRAMRDIEQYSGEGATRWNTKPPEGNAALRAKIEDIKHFLESETSTKKGLQRIANQKLDKLNKNFGTNMSWSQWRKYFDSKLSDKTDKSFGSKTRVRAFVWISQNKEQVVKDLQKQDLKELNVPNSVVGKAVKKILKDYGPDVEDLLKGMSK